MIYLQLFFEFFKTGLFAIGGGLATLPFLYEMQARTGWFTLQDISNMIAVSESTPGPMGVNMATYVGYTICGIPGSIIAVLGLILPSIIIIMIVSNILERFKTNQIVQYALYGLRAASAGLIMAAGLRVAAVAMLHTETLADGFSLALFNPVAIIYAVILYAVYKKVGKNPIYYIIVSGVLGIVLSM